MKTFTEKLHGPLGQAVIWVITFSPLVFYFLLRIAMVDEYETVWGFYGRVAIIMPPATLAIAIMGWSFGVLLYGAVLRTQSFVTWQKAVASVVMIITAGLIAGVSRMGYWCVVAQHEDASELKELYENPSARASTAAMFVLAGNPKLTPEIQARMASESENVYALRRIADRFDIQPSVVATLLQNPKTEVLGNLARNSKISVADMTALASNPHPHIALNLAKNPLIVPEVLDKLAKSDSELVREAVAKNFRASAGTLSMLVHDQAEAVRTSVAANPNASEQSLLDLTTDASGEVRYFVTKNPKATPVVLQKLTEDQDERARFSARGRLGI